MKRKFKDEVIGRRRFELFMRDPLKQAMERVYREIFTTDLDKESSKKTKDFFILWERAKSKWNSSIIQNRQSKGDSALPHPQSRIENVREFIHGKDNFIDYISWDDVLKEDIMTTHDTCFTFSSGARTVIDYGRRMKPFLHRIKKKIENPLTRESKEFESKGWIFEYLDGAYDDRGNVYMPIAPDTIALGIDIGGITKKDESQLKAEIWKIIESKITERKGKVKGQRKSIPAVRDPEELGFLSAMKDETFEDYLKWYDLHMGGDYVTPKGLHFRTIALHDYIDREHPDKAEEAKRKIATERKGVIGQPVKGEDKVEKGVKLIYQAIYRKEYPSKKRMELFNCPQHGKNCSINCMHLNKWYKEFDKRNKLRPLHTTDPSKLDNIRKRNE